MRVEEGRTCFLELLEALDIPFPAKKGTVLAPCLQKGQGLPVGSVQGYHQEEGESNSSLYGKGLPTTC